MIRRTVGYAAAVLVTGYLFLMYDTPALSAALVLEILYPVVSFACLHNMSARLTAGIGKVPAMGEKNQKIRVKLWVNNTSRIWNGKYELRVKIGGRNSGQMTVKKMSGMLEPGRKKALPFYFTSEYCGSMEVALDGMKIFDFFGLFYRTIPLADKAYVGIMPKAGLMPLEITRRTREFLADADEYSVEKSGDDPSEIYQIREYRPWDSVHDIHWKLTAKEDALMVKEYSFPLGCVVLVWMEYPKKGQSSEGFSKMLESAASLCMTLAGEKCIHMAAWFEEKNMRIVKWKVSSEETVHGLLWRMLEMEPYTDDNMRKACYEDAFRGEHFSSIVKIDGQGGITVDGEKQELLQL